MADIDGKTWFSMKALEDGVAEVYIYDEIGLWGVRSADFVRAWKGITKGASRVDLHLNSPGGDLNDGFAIYNTIRQSKKDVTAYVDGWAASTASLVAMAGDRVVIADNGLMMVHNPWTITAGNAEELRKSADVLDKHRDAMLGAYTKKTGMGDDEIKALLDAETWMTADEALEMGFADEKATYADEARASVWASARFDAEKYRNQFKNLRPEWVSALKGAADTAQAGQHEEIVDMGDEKKKPDAPEPAALDPEKIAAEAVAADRKRAGEIRALAVEGQEELVQQLIDEGKTVDEATRALFADMKERGAAVLAELKEKSDALGHRNMGHDDKPKGATQEELQKSFYQAFRDHGADADTAERRAKVAAGIR